MYRPKNPIFIMVNAKNKSSFMKVMVQRKDTIANMTIARRQYVRREFFDEMRDEVWMSTPSIFFA